MADRDTAESPPAGWYPNPDLPGSESQRYWDGGAWTDQYRDSGGEARDDRALTIAGGLAVIGVGVAVALTGDDADLENTSERIGYGAGILFLVAILLAIRFAYVKLFAKSKPVWTPWIFFFAAVLGGLLVLGNLSEEQ